MPTKTPASDDFRLAMRTLAASVSIVAARCGDVRAGLTATAVCSVSISPALLLVCVNAQASAHDVIARAQRFSVNVLSEAHSGLADIFAGRSSHGRAERFDAAEASWSDGPDGIPTLESAVATIGCRIVQAIPAGTHTVFIGEVIGARCAADARPLLYAKGGYHGVGRPLGGGR